MIGVLAILVLGSAAAADPAVATTAEDIKVEVATFGQHDFIPIAIGTRAPLAINDGVQTEPVFAGEESLRVERWGSMLVSLTPWTDGHTPELPNTQRPAGIVRVAMAVPGPASDAGTSRELERCWFAWYEPKVETRGTAVLLPGMFGTPRWILETWTEQLTTDGWLVVRMVTQPSRFTERRRFDVDDGIEPVAQQVADVFDARLIACAVSVAEACDTVEGKRPDLAELPRIAIGLSGGGLMLPTVVAHDAERYNAAVVLAGGADLVTVIAESNYAPFIGAVSIRRGDRKLLEWELRELSEAYLAAASEDPYHAATRMGSVETLIVQGTRDRAVPASSSDLLWTRMGEPDRWLWPAGHEVLALALQSRFGEVLDWIDEAVEGNDPDGRPQP